MSDELLVVVYPEQALGVKVSVPVPPSVQTVFIPGPPGPVGTDAPITYTAGVGGVRAYQVVFVENTNTVAAANAQNSYHAGRIIGIAMSDALEGEAVSIRRSGSISYKAKNLSPGVRYFLNAGGELHSDPDNMAFIQKIGIAEAIDKLFIQIEPPIIL